jgi:hypothetical protein
MTKATLRWTILALVVAAATALPALGAHSAAISPHAYSTKITGAAPAVLNGTWRLTVRQTTYAVTKGSSLAVSGSARIAGNRITFHDLAGPFACRGAQATGVYTWRIVGKSLTLTAVKEPCAGRKTVLTKRFTRVV